MIHRLALRMRTMDATMTHTDRVTDLLSDPCTVPRSCSCLDQLNISFKLQSFCLDRRAVQLNFPYTFVCNLTGVDQHGVYNPS